jgi:hypothetical protein
VPELIGDRACAEPIAIKEGCDSLAVGVRHHPVKSYAGPNNAEVTLDVVAAAERLGYPTQKPESLLERIIGASSNAGDIVLDPFCGCGTTVTVAEKMNRRWVGIDISPTAVNIMDRRLKRVAGASSPTLIGLPSSVDNLRALKPFEFQNWVIQQFYGVSSTRKSGDMGVDGYVPDS